MKSLSAFFMLAAASVDTHNLTVVNAVIFLHFLEPVLDIFSGVLLENLSASKVHHSDLAVVLKLDQHTKKRHGVTLQVAKSAETLRSLRFKAFLMSILAFFAFPMT